MNCKKTIIYTIIYQISLLSVFGYAVFIDNHSGWWMLLYVVLSGSQFKPSLFQLDIEV